MHSDGLTIKKYLYHKINNGEDYKNNNGFLLKVTGLWNTIEAERELRLIRKGERNVNLLKTKSGVKSIW